MKGILAALIFLALAAPAQASFTVTPSTTQAGAGADIAIHADFASTPSRVALHLPPGLVGNPNSAARCALATFRSARCAPASRVGTATAHSGVLALSGGVYNLEPEPGEPARLGIAIELLSVIPLVRNEASITLRPDGGLDSTIAQLQTGGLSLDALDLTLDGSFMTMPTACEAAVTTIEADTTQSASFTPTGCEGVPFTPSVSAALETTQRVVPSGATVGLTLPAGQAHVRRAEIALPVGTTLSPGVASGLETCSDAQFAATACPAASQIGTVSFVTPLLGQLGGNVYFALGSPYRLFVVVQGGGVLVKLAGDVRLDPATGQVTTVFDNLPQVPFTSFALTFRGGPHAVLANPPACGTKTLSAVLTPWTRKARQDRERELHDRRRRPRCGVHGGGLTPALRVAATSTAAGRPAGAVTLDISRPDGSEEPRARDDRTSARAGRKPQGRPALHGRAGGRGRVPRGDARRLGQRAGRQRRGAGAAERNGVAHRPDRRRPCRACHRDPRPRRARRPRHGRRASEHHAARGRRADRAHQPAAAADRRRPGVDPPTRADARPPGLILNASSCAASRCGPCWTAPTARRPPSPRPTRRRTAPGCGSRRASRRPSARAGRPA